MDPYLQRNSADVIHQLQTVIAELPDGKTAFGDLVEALGNKSFALGILIFALPMVLPMPPGIPMAAGIIISMFAVQAMVSTEQLRLPRWLSRKSIEKTSLLKASQWLRTYLGWLLKLCRPRLHGVMEGFARQLAAFAFLILGILMILPIPVIGNIFPALACSILALGMLANDGVVFLLGLIISLLATLSSILMGLGAVAILERIF